MTTTMLPPIKGFIETSFIDWPGQVCAVVFLPYCNLRCPYCHNHSLVLKPDTLETFTLERILNRATALREWIDGLCITGGEPTIHHGVALLLKAIHEAGFKTKLDTNGTQPEVLDYLMAEKLIDHVAMDVKAPLNDAAYARCAGVYVPAEIIRKSVEVIMKRAVPSTFRCTVVPSLLTEEDVYDLARDLREMRAEYAPTSNVRPTLTLQNFNPADPMEPALKEVKPLPYETLARLQAEVNRILA